MTQRYKLIIVWRGAHGAMPGGQHVIEAADTLSAIWGAEAFWRTQTVTEWPLGFDLFDPVGRMVHQFRSGGRSDVQSAVK